MKYSICSVHEEDLETFEDVKNDFETHKEVYFVHAAHVLSRVSRGKNMEFRKTNNLCILTCIMFFFLP